MPSRKSGSKAARKVNAKKAATDTAPSAERASERRAWVEGGEPRTISTSSKPLRPATTEDIGSYPKTGRLWSSYNVACSYSRMNNSIGLQRGFLTRRSAQRADGRRPTNAEHCVAFTGCSTTAPSGRTCRASLAPRAPSQRRTSGFRRPSAEQLSRSFRAFRSPRIGGLGVM